jgi:hypothetical protein
MRIQAYEVRYPSLRVWSVAAIVAVSVAISALLVWMPRSSGMADVAFVPDQHSAPPPGVAAEQARIHPVRADGNARIRVKCAQCGVVRSAREIGQLDAAVDPTTAGGGAKGGRDGIDGRPAKRYEITVRMKDGSNHVFTAANPAKWRPGEGVIVIGGASPAKD